jgi:hypothetical protein
MHQSAELDVVNIAGRFGQEALITMAAAGVSTIKCDRGARHATIADGTKVVQNSLRRSLAGIAEPDRVNPANRAGSAPWLDSP